MKNLKKVLALVLAFACAFTMFAGAAFTDQADFAVDAEVVDSLVALGVIDGYDDGSFRPDATVTRAEMAKMIYVVRTGRSDASAYNDDVTTFTDIDGHWARGYIKYCQSLGIISGKSTTIFDPDATVTTQEAAKMLLVTLGYNAIDAGLEGTGWGNRTIALADQNGLLEDVNCGTTAAAPRQYAAQLIYNTIKAYTVVVRDGEYTNMNAVGDGFNMTVGQRYMGLYFTPATKLTSFTQEENRDTFTTTLNGTTLTRIATDYSYLMGQEVVAMYKSGDTSKVYGMYAVEDSKVLAEGTVGQLESVSSSNTKVELNGTEYSLDNAISSIYADVMNDTTAVKLNDLADKDTVNMVAGTVKLIDNNGNGKVDTVLYVPAAVAKVTYVGSQSMTMNNGIGAMDYDDLDVYEGPAKDDWVTVIGDTYTVSGDTAVAKIDVTNAKVSSTKGGATAGVAGNPYEVRVDSTWYKVATDQAGDKIVAGNEYDLVIVNNYVVNAEETEASSSDVLFVADYDDVANSFQTSGSTQQVVAYFLDGTHQTITVEKIDGKDVDSSTYKIDEDTSAYGVNELYTYSKRSNGNYSLKPLDAGNKAGYEAIGAYGAGGYNASAERVGYTDTASGAYKAIADDAVFFVAYGANHGGARDDIKVVSGKTVKNWNNSYGDAIAYATKMNNGIEYITVGVIVDTAAYSGAGSDNLYAYMTGNSYTDTADNEDNDARTAYPVWTGTEDTILYVDGNDGPARAAGDILIYTQDGEFIEVATASNTKTFRVAITGLQKESEGMIAVTGYNMADDSAVVTTYQMNEDCVYIAINDDKQTGMEGSSLANVANAEETTTPGTYYLNAYIVVDNTSKEVLAVVYDADNNRLDGNETADLT